MGRQSDKKRAVILRRRFAKASKNLDEAGIGIARYQEALREVRESGNVNLECDVLADGVDVVVDGREWSLAVYPDGWLAFNTGLELVSRG
jgi:hypothetical protein